MREELLGLWVLFTPLQVITPQHDTDLIAVSCVSIAPGKAKGAQEQMLPHIFLLVLDAFFYSFSIISFRLSNKEHSSKKALKALPENAHFTLVLVPGFDKEKHKV